MGQFPKLRVAIPEYGVPTIKYRAGIATVTIHHPVEFRLFSRLHILFASDRCPFPSHVLRFALCDAFVRQLHGAWLPRSHWQLFVTWLSSLPQCPRRETSDADFPWALVGCSVLCTDASTCTPSAILQPAAATAAVDSGSEG
jgi:hypothetical protein